MKHDRRSTMFRRSRVLTNGLALVSASALATSLTASVPASAAGSADIAVTASPYSAVVPQGGFVTSTATVTNLSTTDASQNVVLKTGGALGRVTTSPGVSVSCATSSSSGPTITTCTTPSLPSGGWVTISVPHHVFYFPHGFGGGDEAWATSDTFDPNLNNNVAYATWHRICSPCL
jgi:hypothetical protein